MAVVYESKIKNATVDRLFEAILQLKDIDECYRFFEDLCTINEIKSLAQRLEVAEMLRNGETYNEIAERTGASTATISRVNRCLEYGAGGYQRILDRLNSEQDGDA
jgi:TrpR-related protein YerC/YecD